MPTVSPGSGDGDGSLQRPEPPRRQRRADVHATATILGVAQHKGIVRGLPSEVSAAHMDASRREALHELYALCRSLPDVTLDCPTPVDHSHGGALAGCMAAAGVVDGQPERTTHSGICTGSSGAAAERDRCLGIRAAGRGGTELRQDSSLTGSRRGTSNAVAAQTPSSY